jgi:hypothetical protein
MCMHAAKQGEGSLTGRQAGKSPLLFAAAAFAYCGLRGLVMMCRAIAHAIDGARYDLHGFGTLVEGGVWFLPGESSRG